MSWKEKRLITILSIILAVLCAAVLVVLSIRYRAAQGPLLAFTRSAAGETILCACNAGDGPAAMELGFPRELTPLLGRAHVDPGEEGPTLTIPPLSGAAFLVHEG